MADIDPREATPFVLGRLQRNARLPVPLNPPPPLPSCAVPLNPPPPLPSSPPPLPSCAVFVIFLDGVPIGYVPSEEAARFYANALAESKKELLQRDTWTDSSLHIQDNTFCILQRNLGLVYNSGTKVVHEITFEKVNKVSVDELELPVPPSS